MKIKRTEWDGKFIGYSFKCPGCGNYHNVHTQFPNSGGHVWKLVNNDMNNPSFSPSLNQTTGHFCPGQKQPPDCSLCNEGMDACGRCHVIVTEGKLNFCPDSTHHLSGQQGVEMYDIPEHENY
jgi:hypothetical protein